MTTNNDFALLLQQVTKVYGEGENATEVLRGISLKVEAGEFVALAGPSGSGKTTLLAIAGGLLQASGGVIQVKGKNLDGLTPSQMTQFRLENIGFVLQSSNLIPYLTIRDQLLLVNKLAGIKGRNGLAESKQLLTELGLAHRLNHYPEQLSGGERQRVAIARALMNDPQLLLVDEPTASLDSKRGREVVEMLRSEVKNRGKAAVMVTHDERVFDLCDRVIYMADGKLQENHSQNDAKVAGGV
jgi:putative ABC transport system ATP-binding protein